MTDPLEPARCPIPIPARRATTSPTAACRRWRAWPPSPRRPGPAWASRRASRRLKRYHYAFVRLHEILTARITAEPIYELKTGFSPPRLPLRRARRRRLRTRVGEMREPPLGLEAVPAPGAGGLLRRDPRRADDGGAARRRLREGPAGPRRRPGAAPGRHQPAGRRPFGPRLPVRPAGAGRHDRLRRRSASLAWSTTATTGGDAALAARCCDDCLAAAGGLDGTADAVAASRSTRMYSANALRLRPASRGATSGSRTSATRGSTPRRSSTTRVPARSPRR